MGKILFIITCQLLLSFTPMLLNNSWTFTATYYFSSTDAAV